MIARDDVDAADRVVDEIQERLWSVRAYPYSGQDVSWLLVGLRRLTVRRYLIFYSVADSPKSLIVERVLHSSRNVEALFQKD